MIRDERVIQWGIQLSRSYLVAGVGVLLIIAGMGITGCGEKEEPAVGKITIPEGAPEEESLHTEIIFTDSSWTKARLQVGRARRYAARMETLLDSGLYVEFYERDGTLNAILTADSARIDDRTGNMCAFGEVHVKSEKNLTDVDTKRLCYDKEQQLLHSDSWVKVVDHGRGRVIEGVGFESDEGLKNYKIFDVSGQVARQE